MTTINAFREAVYQRLDTQWGTRTPYLLADDVEDRPREDHILVEVDNVGPRSSTFGAVGSRKFVRDAIVRFLVYTDHETGWATNDGHMQKLLDDFEGVSLSGGTKLLSGTVNELPPEDHFLVGQVEIEARYEEIK